MSNLINLNFNSSANVESVNFSIRNITIVSGLKTFPDLVVWIYIITSTFFGLLLNLLVLKSILRIKLNGKSFSDLIHNITFENLFVMVMLFCVSKI